MSSFLQFMADLPAFYIYLVLFIMIFMENITPLVPGDTFLAFSAYLAGRSILDPLFTFSLTITGSLTGFLLVYLVGSHWGREYFDRKDYRFLSTRRMKKADRYFNKYGDWILLINRFAPGFRFLVAIIAGFTKTRLPKTLLLTFISIAAWNGLVFQLGKTVGENWEMIKAFLKRYNTIASVVLIAIVAIIAIYYISRKSVKTGEY